MSYKHYSEWIEEKVRILAEKGIDKWELCIDNLDPINKPSREVIPKHETIDNETCIENVCIRRTKHRVSTFQSIK